MKKKRIYLKELAVVQHIFCGLVYGKMKNKKQITKFGLVLPSQIFCSRQFWQILSTKTLLHRKWSIHGSSETLFFNVAERERPGNNTEQLKQKARSTFCHAIPPELSVNGRMIRLLLTSTL